MRYYYTEYARHCLRFYCRHPAPKFDTESARRSWQAAERAVESFSPRHQRLLKSLYENRDTLADAVYEAALLHDIPQDTIWTIVTECERRTAKNRGLL